MKKLKLSALHKETLEKKEMNCLTGGEYYCYDSLGGGTVKFVYKANQESGKCSCICNGNEDYYSTTQGLNTQYLRA